MVPRSDGHHKKINQNQYKYGIVFTKSKLVLNPIHEVPRLLISIRFATPMRPLLHTLRLLIFGRKN